MTKKVTMYGTEGCPFCLRSERLLQSKGVSDLIRIAVDANPEERRVMIARSGRSSVPQIFVGDTHVGGFDDLAALDRAGRFEELLGK
ncbi:MAG: glutaredoxin 3 [Betaproteobacteria bacterium RIFCSPLOWO2_12_FULL_62_13b]|nr:MAG: glutaredoxin 3 [Betaproteobacteria bacterium RIFCSPLOWO2_12_FULL_62_13b]